MWAENSSGTNQRTSRAPAVDVSGSCTAQRGRADYERDDPAVAQQDDLVAVSRLAHGEPIEPSAAQRVEDHREVDRLLKESAGDRRQVAEGRHAHRREA